ncbi:MULTISPECIES: hypothetical protein [unclassified Moorena]|uniref:hypothetical protein n=1 Tax=unclassified Moorena TaxID=2683338 RepID=UPI0010FA85E2|nr:MULTISPECIES: hypothetical protein [unclassified Moorena]NEQ05519.1 hypothetical protein [Moorena sp. SIO4E2]NEQ16880.1 hypothetical protein [Moorena sp. SIO3E2]NES42303.1 hypothetical protein [Moorena sp. SIO2C4]
MHTISPKSSTFQVEESSNQRLTPIIWDYVRKMVVEYLWYCYGVEIGSTAESRLSDLIAKSVTSAYALRARCLRCRQLLAHAT